MAMGNIYSVDIPNACNLTGSWVDIGTFGSREEAIQYVQNLFGADEEGKINLVSEIECEDDE